MRERMVLSAVLGWSVLIGGEAEAGNCVVGAAAVQANAVTVALAATFAVPTIIGSVVTPSAAIVVPQAVVVSPSVAVAPVIVQQRIRVSSVSRLGLRSLRCR